MLTRRDFLRTVGIGSLAGSVACTRSPPIAVSMSGPDVSVAHRLRGGEPFPQAAREQSIETLIVGGGVGGLTAAWRLTQKGYDRFLLLEGESEPGGNSRAGRYDVGAVPLGAHYLPLPTADSRHVREILAAIGVLKGDPFASKPLYDETALAYAPQERLFENGFWHESLVPTAMDDPATRAEIVRFKSVMEGLKKTRGRDGRAVFAIPLDLSSQDPHWLSLDAITMADWLRREGYRSQALHWWVNYGCKDDYGTDYRQTSAWAGLHYFASRTAEAANAEAESVLTWPEGNAFITSAMQRQIGRDRLARGFVFAVEADGEHVVARSFNPATQRAESIRCKALIWAAPAFVLALVGRGLSVGFSAAAKALSYAPWLTATLTLREPPIYRTGAPLAWDNVLFESPSVGYINSSHQVRWGHLPKRTALSYYWPLTHVPPKEAREQLLSQPSQHWRDAVLADLTQAHPEISQITERIDFWRNGHAMARPTPGVIWGGARSALATPHPRVLLAHADASGMSIFEEASWHGWRAADAVLQGIAR